LNVHTRGLNTVDCLQASMILQEEYEAEEYEAHGSARGPTGQYRWNAGVTKGLGITLHPLKS
jgi:hypothetical protein